MKKHIDDDDETHRMYVIGKNKQSMIQSLY